MSIPTVAATARRAERHGLRRARTRRGALALLLAALGTGACMERPAAVADLPMPSLAGTRQITTSGTGRVAQLPTRADFECWLISEGAGPETAWAAGGQKLAGVVRALEAAGVPAVDIQVREARLVPGGAEGQRLIQILNVTGRDLQRLGALFTAALAGGATRVENLRLSLAEPQASADRARERALLAARDKATHLAQELALRLGRVVTVVEEFDGSSASRAADVSGPAPSALEIEATVRVTWELVD